jgi:hypothetical protein
MLGIVDSLPLNSGRLKYYSPDFGSQIDINSER